MISTKTTTKGMVQLVYGLRHVDGEWRRSWDFIWNQVDTLNSDAGFTAFQTQRQ